MAEKNELVKTSSMGSKTILIGAFAGAAAGLIIANILHKRASRQNRESVITPAEGVQLGLLLFGLFKAIMNLGGSEK